ncbi:MAG: hypothetical protein JO329_20900 [Planctomycetaceae bacterium]|nr:hypothetical protein [Planctomycetaceae bacterium]
MSIFRRRGNYGKLLLGIWLIATGVVATVPVPIPFLGLLLSLLAIAAGIFLLLDR